MPQREIIPSVKIARSGPDLALTDVPPYEVIWYSIPQA